MELTYTKIGDYYYPDLCLPPVDDDRPLGKYGTLRKTYLKQHHPMMYDRLLLAGKLDGHLRESTLWPQSKWAGSLLTWPQKRA